MSKKHRSSPQSQKLPNALLDIIIPVYQMPDLVIECAKHIPHAAGNISYMVHIFDNGSSEENYQMYHSQVSEILGSNVRFTRSRENLGFPIGCNRAVAKGRAPLIFLLNDDVFLYPESINLLVRAMDEPNNGVAAPLLIFDPNSIDPNRPAGKVQHVGMSTNIRGEWTHNFIGWTPDNPKVRSVKYSYGATGAAFMTRRNLWNKIGGFWEGYGLGYFEDVDYCMSIHEMNLLIRIVTEAVGVHLTNATTLATGIQNPMPYNRMKFMDRWGAKLRYTDWEIW